MCCRAPYVRRARQVAPLFIFALIVLSCGSRASVKAWQTAKPADSPETLRVKQALDAPFNFVIEPQSLKDAMDAIAKHSRIRVRLDEKALAQARIDITAEVQVAKSGKPLRQVLTLLFQQLPRPVAFRVRNGELLVTPGPQGKELAPAK